MVLVPIDEWERSNNKLEEKYPDAVMSVSNKIVAAIPENGRVYAMAILVFLEKEPIWNNAGEIVYKGSTIPKSSIIELMSYTVISKKGTPIGLKEFCELLLKKNIPLGLIQNDNVKQIMTDFGGIKKRKIDKSDEDLSKKKKVKTNDIKPHQVKWLSIKDAIDL